MLVLKLIAVIMGILSSCLFSSSSYEDFFNIEKRGTGIRGSGKHHKVIKEESEEKVEKDSEVVLEEKIESLKDQTKVPQEKLIKVKKNKEVAEKLKVDNARKKVEKLKQGLTQAEKELQKLEER